MKCGVLHVTRLKRSCPIFGRQAVCGTKFSLSWKQTIKLQAQRNDARVKKSKVNAAGAHTLPPDSSSTALFSELCYSAVQLWGVALSLTVLVRHQVLLPRVSPGPLLASFHKLPQQNAVTRKAQKVVCAYCRLGLHYLCAPLLSRTGSPVSM